MHHDPRSKVPQGVFSCARRSLYRVDGLCGVASTIMTIMTIIRVILMDHRTPRLFASDCDFLSDRCDSLPISVHLTNIGSRLRRQPSQSHLGDPIRRVDSRDHNLDGF